MHSRFVLVVTCAVAWLGLTAVVPAEKTASPFDSVTNAAFKKQFTDYVSSHHQTPEDYVADQFKDHDIVFLGESHGLKQNHEFIYSLMKRLHERGIYTLVLEFGLYENQGKIDQLVTGATWDQKLADDIWYGTRHMGTGVYRTAWQINHDRPAGTRPFRVVVFGRLDGAQAVPRTVPLAERDKVADKFLGGHRKDMMNRFYADVIAKEVIAKGDKAVVYCGSGHAGTKFRMNRLPLTPHFTSLGNFVYNYIRDRTMTIGLHGSVFIKEEMFDPTADNATGAPVQAAIESLMEGVPAQYRRAGLSTAGTPLGTLPLPGARGYREGRSSDFKLADYVDGYIYLAKRSEFIKDKTEW
jgi:hypothetical protein